MVRVVSSAPKLRHVIALQRPVSVKDAVGGFSMAYDTLANPRAEITPLSTRDRFLAAQSQSEATHRITIRFDNRVVDMDGSWRILFGARTFMIEGFPRNLDERNQWLEIIAIEGLRTE